MTQHPRATNFFVSDYDDKWDVLTRDQAIELSQRMRHRVDLTVFYTDLGWSSGMTNAKQYCMVNDLDYEERTLDVASLSTKIAFCSLEFCKAIIDGNPYQEFLE